jgi:hypothetical protein
VPWRPLGVRTSCGNAAGSQLQAASIDDAGRIRLAEDGAFRPAIEPGLNLAVREAGAYVHGRGPGNQRARRARNFQKETEYAALVRLAGNSQGARNDMRQGCFAMRWSGDMVCPHAA